ncbi:hypothetical protein Leryth_015423 [Lithospermum erythrorhizon]|nr:hypothetical protein Leryth_015423 [Lithospermum erythrorhizon]
MLSEMWADILLQLFLIISTILVFIFMLFNPKNLLSKLRPHTLPTYQSKRHFVKGAQLLSKARSQNDVVLAKSAESEADQAIKLDPLDAAGYLLKAMALEVQGLKELGIECLDLALERKLEEEERANALLKRAEMRMEVSQHGEGAVDLVVGDLVESVGLRESGKGFLLLGRCYEEMGLVEKAKKAFQDAVKVQPGYEKAQKELDRLVAS